MAGARGRLTLSLLLVLLAALTRASGGEAQGDAGPLLSYSVEGADDLHALLSAHAAAQEDALRRAAAGPGAPPPPPALRVVTSSRVGLGNRLPSVTTGYALALLTRRAFLLSAPELLQHFALPLSASWPDHAPLYAGASECDVGGPAALADASLALCGNGSAAGGPVRAAVASYASIDYDMPFLQANPSLAPALGRLFPDGEAFHALAAHLLARPAPAVAAALGPYAARAASCAVGLQLRTRKFAPVDPAQFAAIARSLAPRGVVVGGGGGAGGGSVFVASDDAGMFGRLAALLPGNGVWWSDLTFSSVNSSRTAAGNPGTELSAVVDVLLLGRCRHVVVTPSSSLGAVAAGLAGVRPVYATYGDHSRPFFNPFFWGSTTSEPCCFKLSATHRLRDEALLARMRRHPLFYHHAQCHHR